MSSAENQQERLEQSAVPIATGYFLSGFALGEASFMIVCRPRDDYGRRWKLSAAFNVSQNDRAPLDLFREALGVGTMRRAGAGGWYREVNRLSDIKNVVIPFFERFPLVGTKAQDFERFKCATALLSKEDLNEVDFVKVVDLREGMNDGGKRKYTRERILRDYTPGPQRSR